MTGNATNIQKTPDHRLRYLIFFATHYACPQIFWSQIYWFSEFAHCRAWVFCGNLNSDFSFIWGTIQNAVVARTARFTLFRGSSIFFTLCHVILITFSRIFFSKLLKITEIKLNRVCPWTSMTVNIQGRTIYFQCTDIGYLLNTDSFEEPAFTSSISSYFSSNDDLCLFIFSDIFETHNLTPQ